MNADSFIADLMRYGFSKSFAEKVYTALREEREDMLESYLHTAELLYNDKEEK